LANTAIKIAASVSVLHTFDSTGESNLKEKIGYIQYFGLTSTTTEWKDGILWSKLHENTSSSLFHSHAPAIPTISTCRFCN